MLLIFKKSTKYLHILKISTIFVSVKGLDMETMTYNRTTLNGARWQIVVDKHGAALYLHNFDKDGFHFSGNYFNTMAEANEYLDRVDERTKNPVHWTPCTTIPADYYGVPGRYYGD